jgi:hypothetical protein
VPHSHTDQLVSQLTTVRLDETIPDSDHMDIPYLPETQLRIARFLTAQFAPAALEELAPSAA